jgi:hypothetical protein
MALRETSNREVEKNTQEGALCSVYFTKYYSGDQIKKNEMGDDCSTYGNRTDAYRVLVVRREGKRLLGRPAYMGKWHLNGYSRSETGEV